jgi:predicted phage baseplate assembly protein
LADHGLTVVGEPIVPQQLPARGPYRPRLQQQGVTFTTGYDAGLARTLPAAPSLTQDPRSALAAVALAGATGSWTVRRTLLDSGPFSTGFVVETENDGSATLRFGDGILGAPPLPGLSATYRIGNGSAGNVGAGAIARLAAPPAGLAGIVGVRNPLPAVGGIDPEPLTDVRLYAPQAFRTQNRAVTTGDYVSAAQSVPGVARAAASLQWTGTWQTAFVTVERSGGLPVDPAFKAAVRGVLEPLRPAGIDLEIEAPVYVPLDIAFTVYVSAGYFAFNVKSQLLAAFGTSVLPSGQLGFFNPANFTFGQAVYLSQMVALAMSVPGVAWVDTGDTPPKPNRFKRWAQASRGELAAGKITLARLEIARLDNDPNRPENGVLQFFTGGGL